MKIKTECWSNLRLETQLIKSSLLRFIKIMRCWKDRWCPFVNKRKREEDSMVIEWALSVVCSSSTFSMWMDESSFGYLLKYYQLSPLPNGISYVNQKFSLCLSRFPSRWALFVDFVQRLLVTFILSASFMSDFVSKRWDDKRFYTSYSRQNAATHLNKRTK